jgi:hypothetical protein
VIVRQRSLAAFRMAGAFTVVGLLFALGGVAQAADTQPPTAPDYQAVCGAVQVGYARCDAQLRTDVPPQLESTPSGAQPKLQSGYGPADLQSAYGLAAAAAQSGSGETVAIVDAFNDPDAAQDLAVYRSQYGLPACTVQDECLKVVSQTGSTTSLPPDPPATEDWTLEESLDLDMVSAICPRCDIDLVEATSDATSDLYAAVDEAVALGAKFVSNSYGGAESSAETSDDSHFDHPGVVMTAATGDDGYGVQYPAASQYVTAVGGTTLSLASNPRGWTESAWAGTGSGCSAYEPKPAWQIDGGCAKRTVADVSAVADPDTGVYVYDSYGADGGWNVGGGTSAAAPIIAATYALAGTPATGAKPESYPYAHIPDLFDVTSGSTASCSPSYLCTAQAGYDGPTGLGTPDGITAFTPGAGVGGLANAVQAYQDPTTMLGTAIAAGGFNPGPTLAPGTSPAITTLPGGGYEEAIQNSSGDLQVYGSIRDIAYASVPIMPGTSPAIAANASGVAVAFQSPSGSLWAYTSYGGTYGNYYDMSLGMYPGTSPSIAPLASAAGGFEIAFQANTGALWTAPITGGGTYHSLGMLGGTSPAIAANAGGYDVAFQADSGVLWTYSSASGVGHNLGLGMKSGTSPSITPLAGVGGGFDIAFQANTGQLYTCPFAGGGVDVGLGMLAGTSPSIAAAPGGYGYYVAMQANSGQLWDFWSFTGVGYDLGVAMAPGTGPDIATP